VVGPVSREDSGVIDLFAICARASASPAGDLRPPDLYSVAPPLADASDDADHHALARLFAKRSRTKVAIAAGAAALLVIGIIVVSVSGGRAEAAQANVPKRVQPTAPVALPNAALEAPTSPPPRPAAVVTQLPAPPTTGAPLIAKAPPRQAQPGVAKTRAPAPPAGPKMTKVQSGGVAGH
jgi:hypothetical protein